MSKTKFIVFTLIALLIPAYNSLAQQLEKIPGQDPEVPEGMNSLIYYLDSLYKFGISITGILAIFMIALGAFAYIVTSAGNASKMLDAKEKITNALIGLVIALTAYLFLYVINPDLVGGTLESPGEIMSQMVSGEEDEGGGGDNSYDGVECDNEGSCGRCLNCSDCPNDLFYQDGESYFCGENNAENQEGDEDNNNTENENEDDHGLGDMMPEEEDMQ
jgi:hypothetical protein